MALAFNTLTLGELSKIEELSGQSIDTLEDAGTPKGKTLAAIAFIIKKREDASFKWNDALELTVDQANEIIGLDDEDETADEGEDSPKDDD